MFNIPRPEYPRPQMVRKEWLNLNGEWEFEIDNSKSGKNRGFYNRTKLNQKIIVPFCPESKLSGIENKDFMNSVWYRKEFSLPTTWHSEPTDSKIILHFGAVDYETEVWINGTSVGTHKGGYTPFSFDITNQMNSDNNSIIVYAEDNTRSGLQPIGKQCENYYSNGCSYTRTTGIWQTVWLEKVPQTYISSFKLIPDPDNSCVHIATSINGLIKEQNLQATAIYNGKIVGENTSVCTSNDVHMTLNLSEVNLWEVGNPNLYDLKLSLINDNNYSDNIDSYFGLRKISWDNNVILINNKPVFQRLVLDQGFYPDGIYTAPTDADLKADIEMSMAVGFNGARMHQKVFEPRYIYWADKLGYLVWGEEASWGLNITNPMGLERFLPEWIEALERDFNHPAIVGWCPFNETWDNNGTKQDNEILRITYQVTKALDKTRPVIDTSGNFHVITDIFDVHDYDQNPKTFADRYEPIKNNGERYVSFPDRQHYENQPYFVSEYGGIGWDSIKQNDTGWGYGKNPENEEEFISRYKGLTSTLLNNPHICAFCYTQLYDVEQEINGLYTYDRKPKFNPEIFKKINTQKAAIEK